MSNQIPSWRGEPIAGKTILLYGELGYGDEILALRFAKLVKEMGARVIVSARPPLVRLACSLVFADAVVAQYGPAAYECATDLQHDPPPWTPDYVCALLAVPMFATPGFSSLWQSDDGRNISAELTAAKGLQLAYPTGGGCRGRYVGAKFATVDTSRLTKLPAGLNVGICWASGAGDQKFAARKSIALQTLAPLSKPGVNLLSLQLDHGEDLRDSDIVDAMAGVRDFADTARIIERLDLVITVDTAVAHLAGALGKPVWNLVRSDATSVWPWFWDTEVTSWYESMALYRQSEEGDWTDPMQRMFADFDRWRAAALASVKALAPRALGATA